MNDQEPKYFTKFKEELNEKLDKIDKSFDASKEQIAKVFESITILEIGFNDVNRKLDAHAEQIAKVSVQVTTLGVDIKRVETKINNNIFKTIDTEQRTEKLEKVVFA